MNLNLSPGVATADRPGVSDMAEYPEAGVGLTLFDTTLGQPIWWDGAQWVDATGAPA